MGSIGIQLAEILIGDQVPSPVANALKMLRHIAVMGLILVGLLSFGCLVARLSRRRYKVGYVEQALPQDLATECDNLETEWQPLQDRGDTLKIMKVGCQKK